MAEEKKPLGFLVRLSALREEANGLDWKDDGYVENTYKPSQSYGFVSETKLKRNMAPLLCRHAIEMGIDYSDLKAETPLEKKPSHYSVRIALTFYDIYDTGKCMCYHAYGEGADVLDKAINIAQTDALKQVFFNEFLVTDRSSEPEREEKPERPLTVAQRAEIVSKMEDKVVVASISKAETAPAPETAPASETAPAAPAAPAPAPKVIGAVTPGVISPLQHKAMDKTLDNLRKLVEEGTRQKVDLDQAQAEYDDAIGKNSASQAFAFLTKWRL